MNQNRRYRGVKATKEGIEIIESQRINNGWSRQALADKAEVSLDTYERFLKDKVDKNTIESIVKVFKLQPIDIVAYDEWHGIRKSKLDELAPKAELNESSVPLTFTCYVERPPVESRCYEAIQQLGALIRIKAPQQMGKTLLLDRILIEARKQNYKTVTLSFELPDSTVFKDICKFSQWFCVSVGRLLGLPNELNNRWDDIFGCNDNTTAYFEEYLLVECTSPLVLALDKVDRVFEHSAIANDFCCLLRGWHDMARRSDDRGAIWKNLRLILVHSTDVYRSLNILSSPLAGVGETIFLPEFNQEQVQDLVQQNGLDWLSNYDVEQLMAIVGGHPYLVQIAFDYLKSQENTLLNLLQMADTEASPFGNYLRKQLGDVQQYPELAAALHQVMTTNNPVTLESAEAFKLNRMGLVQMQGNDCSPRCNLYRQYFSVRLTAT
ncbi:MAG: AAA-like domain-containing protein [Desmonostoc vinosum HA7617-LM4]|jgi:transcriptional regulator with XRE-family HTH domain|nr:AAA-like domain-containing protein [Desmonostoc vinosum HA7617-LM4]